MVRFRRLLGPLGMILLSGCCFCHHDQVEDEVREVTALVDRQVAVQPAADPLPLQAAAPRKEPTSLSASPERALGVSGEQATKADTAPQDRTSPSPARERLLIPPGLPGADAPPLRLPENAAERERVMQQLYPPLSKPPALPLTAPGPEGHPLTLGDLQRLGWTYSPAIKNALSAVEAAKGAVKQAGAYPNPSLFFEQDTVQTFQSGYQGGGVDQVIKTGDKLKLQEAAATMELLNARLALRRAQSDLAYQVRTTYFAVLVALESVRINDALYRFADEIYQTQLALLPKGFAAPYEPMQLRPLVVQARLNLVQAQNQYRASWKQLAAAIGLPDMPPSELEGRVDLPVPQFQFDEVREQVVNNHTDVLTALNSLRKAQYNLKLARVMPLPDVDVNLMVQKDGTTPPFNYVHSLRVSVPVPVWDQNRGAIRQAEGQLAQATAAVPQARNTLTNTLADAFNRYQTTREQVSGTLEQVRDQVRVYRALYSRRQRGPADVGFGDLVTAQQTLGGFIGAYVTALGAQWLAVVDVANLLQTEDLFQTAPRMDVVPVPELDEMLPHHGIRDCVLQATRAPGATGPRKQADNQSPSGAADDPEVLVLPAPRVPCDSRSRAIKEP